ncbi:hypothetical protein [Mucilaginibacter defluvii]|uniref:Tetratricopeptide repeat protein n=1 Tax=Mucilaginibacter defluvii TaxID=1196019 RepID=A0ABP9G3X3_9SPHI
MINRKKPQLIAKLLSCCGITRYICFDEASALVRGLRDQGVIAISYQSPLPNSDVPCVFVFDCSDAKTNSCLEKAIQLSKLSKVSHIAFLNFYSLNTEHFFKKMFNAGFEIHPSSFYFDGDEVVDAIIFSKLPDVHYKKSYLVKDSPDGEFTTPKLHKHVIDVGKTLISDFSTMIVSGDMVGTLAYSLSCEVLGDNIIEIHRKDSSKEYFESKYPKKNIIRTSFLEFDSDEYMEKVDFGLHVTSYPASSDSEIIKKVISCLMAGKRLSIIIKIEGIESLSSKDLQEDLKSISQGHLQLDKIDRIDPASKFIICHFLKCVNLDSNYTSPTLPMGLSHPEVLNSMILFGKRFATPAVLNKHALEVLFVSRHLSAQEGAALCVLLYRFIELLKKGYKLSDNADAIILRITKFLEKAPIDNRSVLRWLISLSYAYGLYLHYSGDFELAEQYYLKCTTFDPLIVNPQMSSKTLLAYVSLGRYALARNDVKKAKQIFRAGLDLTEKAVKSNWVILMGNRLDRPNRFGLPELTNVLNLGAKCADALNVLSIEDADQGLIWKIIDSVK